MVIFTENAVYVQKNDIGYLNNYENDIPASIFMQVFGNGIVIINDSNRYEFEKFDKAHEIEFIKSLDWMVDYNSVKDLSDEEIIKMGQDIFEKRNKIAHEFLAMSEEERNKHTDMPVQCELLDFKAYSLRDILWFKQGHLNITLPEGIDYPKGYVKKEEIEESKEKIEEQTEAKVIQKLKKLFSPKKKK